jgi:uncharacterized protein YndB with AHSA1/START domain
MRALIAAGNAVESRFMEINREPPAWAEREIQIAAPLEVVWDVLSTIEDWPQWNADIKSTKIAGPVAPGTTFRWKAGPGTIKSMIESAERPHVVAWTGRSLGISATHVGGLIAAKEERTSRRRSRWKASRPDCCAPRRRSSSTALWRRFCKR